GRAAKSIPRARCIRGAGTLLRLRRQRYARPGRRSGFRSRDPGRGIPGPECEPARGRWWFFPHPSCPRGRWGFDRAGWLRTAVLPGPVAGGLKVKLRSFVYYHLLTGTQSVFHRIIRLHKALAPFQSRGVQGLKSPLMSTDTQSSSDTSPASRSWLRRFLIKAGVLFAGLGLSGALLGTLALALAWPNLPDLSAMIDYRPRVPLRIYTADNVLIGEFGEERRNVLRFDEIPDVMKAAILAAEDDGFYQHHGIDWKGVARAALANLTTMARSQGASTITMQVARNFYLSSEKTYTRKFYELLLTFKIEATLTKDQILDLYMNQIYLGHRAYGFA